MSLAQEIYEEFKDCQEVSLKEIYASFKDEKKTTIRGRIYRELTNKGLVEKISDGVYSFKADSTDGLIVNGDARDLSFIESESVDLIIADHPYQIQKGTNRNFNSNYIDTTFEYNFEDFKEKARVLKKGGFLVEFLPELKEANMDYIIKILQFAKENGFNLYCKSTWYKAEIRDGNLVDHSAFVGRKAVCEDVYIFSKGKPRKLRERLQGDTMRLESGASAMLPAVFMERPLMNKEKIHKAQKPSGLLSKLIELFSKKGEMVLDQFSGSLALFFECMNLNRKCVAIELSREKVETAFKSR